MRPRLRYLCSLLGLLMVLASSATALARDAEPTADEPESNPYCKPPALLELDEDTRDRAQAIWCQREVSGGKIAALLLVLLELGDDCGPGAPRSASTLPRTVLPT